VNRSYERLLYEAMSQGLDLPDVTDLLEPPAWHASAQCRKVPTLNWFPERGEDVRPLKAVCETCPVRLPCLDAGMAEQEGIWGGTSGIQRKRLRRSSAPADRREEAA
jgi:WhiB family transcriptional regulator, redox-sensing transcriptional regulator